MRHRAFTLVELMVVITVIAVLAGLAVTSFGGSLNKARLAEAASHLRAVTQYAHRTALTNQRICRVVFTLDGAGQDPGYRVEIESNNPESLDTFATITSGLGKPVSLTGNVRFAGVLIENGGQQEQHIITFQPTGEADAASIQLTDGRQTWSVVIEPNTGSSRLVQEAVSRTPNMREDLDA